nr:hypothetical protein [Micromonospora sp. DSM 115978]
RTKLDRQGVRVPEQGVAAQRLAVAAEYLKIALSAQPHAEYLLTGLVGNTDVRLQLDQPELDGILAAPLRVLR